VNVEGTARVFASEFGKATLPLRGVVGDEGVLTPFALPCRLLFIAGALIELQTRGKDYWTGRVADPSGVFEIRTERPDAYLQQALLDLTPPCFVTILGEAKPGQGTPPAPPTLKLLEIVETDRAVRDIWTIRTAETTVRRLSLLVSAIRAGTADAEVMAALRFYGTAEADVREMANTVQKALGTVGGPAREEVRDEDVREKVLAIIRESAGRSGISLDMIIVQAGQEGIDEGRVREAVRALVLDDECYQPARDMFKPL
jgi:RPA family protein